MTQTKNFATSEKIASECATTKSTLKVEDEQYPFIFDTLEQKELFEKWNLNVTKAYEDDSIYYLVIENI